MRPSRLRNLLSCFRVAIVRATTPNNQAQAQPLERDLTCNDDIRASMIGQMPGRDGCGLGRLVLPLPSKYCSHGENDAKERKSHRKASPSPKLVNLASKLAGRVINHNDATAHWRLLDTSSHLGGFATGSAAAVLKLDDREETVLLHSVINNHALCPLARPGKPAVFDHAEQGENKEDPGNGAHGNGWSENEPDPHRDESDDERHVFQLLPDRSHRFRQHGQALAQPLAARSRLQPQRRDYHS